MVEISSFEWTQLCDRAEGSLWSPSKAAWNQTSPSKSDFGADSPLGGVGFVVDLSPSVRDQKITAVLRCSRRERWIPPNCGIGFFLLMY